MLPTLGNHNYCLRKAESAKYSKEQISELSATLYAIEERATEQILELNASLYAMEECATAREERGTARHEVFLSKIAALMAPDTTTIDPSTPVTGGDATFVEATTGNHDDEDDVPALMAQLHHNFSTIQQAFEDLMKTPTKPTTVIKVGTLVDPEDNDESISMPIQPESDALDELRRHLAHATIPSTPVTSGYTSLMSPPDSWGDVTSSAPTPPPPSGVIKTKDPTPDAAYGGDVLTGRNNDKEITGSSPDCAQRINCVQRTLLVHSWCVCVHR